MILKTPEDIGAFIKERRNTLGLTQEELARRCEMSRKWVVEIEKGKPGAALGQVLRAIRVLGLCLYSTNPRSIPRPIIDLNQYIDSFKRR
jgi:HTH-type transcriptional regulator/antitoxin HipB